MTAEMKAVPRPKPVNFEMIAHVEQIKSVIFDEVRVWLEEFAVMDSEGDIILRKDNLLSLSNYDSRNEN